MADGVEITAGTGTTVATDDIGGSQYQRIKVCWGSDGNASDASVTNPLPVNCPNLYEVAIASQTAQVLGSTGAIGDYIAGVLVVPETTSPGTVTLIDDATSIIIFTGGASSVSNLVPFYVPLGMLSRNGAWKLTTGASVHCIGIGGFT